MVLGLLCYIDGERYLPIVLDYGAGIASGSYCDLCLCMVEFASTFSLMACCPTRKTPSFVIDFDEASYGMAE